MPDVSSSLDINSPTVPSQDVPLVPTPGEVPPQKELTMDQNSQNGAKVYRETVSPNTNPKYGVKEILQPPDPYENAEKFNPPVGGVPVAPILNPAPPPVLENKASERVPLKAVEIVSVGDPTVKPGPAPAEKIRTPEVKAVPPVAPPPPVPKEPDYSPLYPPAKKRWSPLLFIVPAVLVLLGLLAFGAYYFLGRPVKTITEENTAPLNLGTEVPAQETSSSSAFKITPPAKETIEHEKAFGTLPPPNLTPFALKDLTLGGTIIANESTASAVLEKMNVMAYALDFTVASVSAIFSPEHKHITGAIKELSMEEFSKQTSAEKSLYPVKNDVQAFNDLVSANALFGLSEKKVDWKKNKLKSLEIIDFYAAYLYTANARFFLPFYIFEGNGKIAGADPKTSDIKLEFFIPAIVE